MKNKFKIIGAIVIVICTLSIFCFVWLNNKSSDIKEDYIAIFHGGSGEVIYETYIYKIDNGKANYGFRYINVTSTTQSYGSSHWIRKITGKGEFDWTDGAFGVARENGAYSYVTIPNSNERYTIEEFQRMFLMN